MLVTMVGLPGSGKSTYAEANFRCIVCPDRIRLDVFGTRFDRTVEPQVWRRAFRELEHGLASDRVVCFDATSGTRRRRRRLIARARDAGRPAVAVWMRSSLDLAWERNVAREDAVPRAPFYHLAEAFEPPTADEGFAAVVEIDASA